MTQRKGFIEIDDTQTYKRCRVQLHAKGVELRDIVTGSEVKTKRQQVCRSGEFLVAEIDAKVGGFGMVSEALEKAIVSSHYFLFAVDEAVLERRFLDYFIRTPAFREQVTAQGSTNYAAIRPADVLGYTMPLPPLPEQRRIVARIDELAAKIEEAKGLRREAVAGADTLLASASEQAFQLRPEWSVAEVNSFCDAPQYGFTASATTDPIGPKMLRITDIQAGRVDWSGVPFCVCPDPQNYLLRENDLVFARTGGTTGKSFVIRNCPEAVFASYLIRLRVRHTVSVAYLYHYFQTPSYWSQITDSKEGTGQPNMNGSKLSNLKVPIPPSLAEQERIVAYLDGLQAKVDALKALQGETAAELSALLPSVLDRAFSGRL